MFHVSSLETDTQPGGLLHMDAPRRNVVSAIEPVHQVTVISLPLWLFFHEQITEHELFSGRDEWQSPHTESSLLAMLATLGCTDEAATRAVQRIWGVIIGWTGCRATGAVPFYGDPTSLLVCDDLSVTVGILARRTRNLFLGQRLPVYDPEHLLGSDFYVDDLRLLPFARPLKELVLRREAKFGINPKSFFCSERLVPPQ